MEDNKLQYVGIKTSQSPSYLPSTATPGFSLIQSIPGTILHAESYGPSFDFPLPSTFTFSNKTGGVLECRVSGEPQPVVSWFSQEGTPLSPYPGIVSSLANGSLHFHPFSPERWRSDLHDSLVRCQAVNVYGSVLSTLVHVKGGEAESFNLLPAFTSCHNKQAES